MPRPGFNISFKQEGSEEEGACKKKIRCLGRAGAWSAQRWSSFYNSCVYSILEDFETIVFKVLLKNLMG